MCRLLGQKLRQIREARGMVLKDVERISGISATHISEIERGRTAPTIHLLTRIAGALEVSTAYLLELPPVETLRVCHSGDRRVLESSDSLAILERLNETWASAELLLHRIRLKPGGALPGEIPPTEDLLVVMEGSVEVEADDEKIKLLKGMGFHACSRSPLEVSNTTGQPAELLWATRSGYQY
jgi:transcriptional regulator with XRE-family HTH domain